MRSGFSKPLPLPTTTAARLPDSMMSRGATKSPISAAL